MARKVKDEKAEAVPVATAYPVAPPKGDLPPGVLPGSAPDPNIYPSNQVPERPAPHSNPHVEGGRSDP